MTQFTVFAVKVYSNNLGKAVLSIPDYIAVAYIGCWGSNICATLHQDIMAQLSLHGKLLLKVKA